MGAYRSKPLTEKTSKDFESNGLMYGVSEMQGWRVSMEDAYTCLHNFDESTSMFAVYDGHGGQEVAQYCANKLPDFIKATEAYKNSNLKESLEGAFREIDQSIVTDEVIKELNELAGCDNDDELDETEMLSEEATMPLEELLKRMKQDKNAPMFEQILMNKGDNDSDEDEESENGNVKENGCSEEHVKNADKSDKKGTKVSEKKQEKEEKDEQQEKKDGDSKEDAKDDEEDEVEEDAEDSESSEDSEDSEEDDEIEEDGVCVPQSDEVGKDSGATAIVALLRGNQLTVANVGDSRCVLGRSKTAVDMSKDHKPEDEIELDRITKAGGKITHDGRVNGGLNLSRAIGDHNYKGNENLSAHEQVISAVPDILEMTLSKEDKFMILACDGIWNIMTSQEAVDFVSEKLQEQEKEGEICVSKICEQMFDHCMAPDTSGDGSGCDNMTCVIVLFDVSIYKNTDKKRTFDNTNSNDCAINPEKKQKLSS